MRSGFSTGPEGQGNSACAVSRRGQGWCAAQTTGDGEMMKQTPKKWECHIRLNFPIFWGPMALSLSLCIALSKSSAWG